jgi:hypothetical protein
VRCSDNCPAKFKAGEAENEIISPALHDTDGRRHTNEAFTTNHQVLTQDDDDDCREFSRVHVIYDKLVRA